MRETFRKLPEKKQIAILDAAAHVFAEHGYYRANVSEICRQARISNGALYKYFRNKEELFVAVLERAVDLVTEGLSRFFPVRGSIYGLVHELVEEVETLAGRYADYIVVYMDLGSPSLRRFSEKLSDRLEGVSRDFWLQLVKEGKAGGEIDPHLDDRVAAYSIDNHVMLFMLACVSLHYARRFENYFLPEGGKLSPEERRCLVVESIKGLLT